MPSGKSWSKSILILVLLALCLTLCSCEVVEATTLQEAESIIKSNFRNLTGVLFLDATQVDQTVEGTSSQPSMVGNLLSSIRGMFSSKGKKTVYEYGQELGQTITVLEIDVSNQELKPIQDMFNVTTVPYLILIYRNQVLYQGTPSSKNSNEIYDLISRADELCSLTPEQGGEIQMKSTPTEIVTSTGEVIKFKPVVVHDDPFYYGDNDPTFDENIYTDAMNGGLISKSDRIPGAQSRERIIIDKDAVSPINSPTRPYQKLSLVDEISYYDDYTTTAEPEPIKVEIEQVKGPEHSMSDPAFDNKVVVDEVVEVEEEIVEEEVEEVVEEPFVKKSVDIGYVTPIKLPQKEAEKSTVTVVNLPQAEPAKDEVKYVKLPQNPKPEVVTREIVREVTPNYIPSSGVETIVYQPVIEETCEEVEEVPARVITETETITRIRSPPARTVNVLEVVPKVRSVDTEVIDEKWAQVLEDEEAMIDKINKLYAEDMELSEKIKQSEQEIRDSEQMYKRAKADIEETIFESEMKMREYEAKINELYAARELALQAREELYQPCNKCSTSETVIEQKLTKPTVKRVRRRNFPADQSNFHDLYESAKHRQRSASETSISK